MLSNKEVIFFLIQNLWHIIISSSGSGSGGSSSSSSSGSGSGSGLLL